MSITNTINSIKQNINNAYTKAEEKGATIPFNKNIENLATTIESIQAGAEPSGTLDITTNGMYNVLNYANANVNVSGGGIKFSNSANFKLLDKININTNVNVNGGGVVATCIINFANTEQ